MKTAYWVVSYNDELFNHVTGVLASQARHFSQFVTMAFKYGCNTGKDKQNNLDFMPA